MWHLLLGRVRDLLFSLDRYKGTKLRCCHILDIFRFLSYYIDDFSHFEGRQCHRLHIEWYYMSFSVAVYKRAASHYTPAASYLQFQYWVTANTISQKPNVPERYSNNHSVLPQEIKASLSSLPDFRQPQLRLTIFPHYPHYRLKILEEKIFIYRFLLFIYIFYKHCISCVRLIDAYWWGWSISAPYLPFDDLPLPPALQGGEFPHSENHWCRRISFEDLSECTYLLFLTNRGVGYDVY